jgi:antitoxin component of MazEF toxin-antitoxin module
MDRVYAHRKSSLWQADCLTVRKGDFEMAFKKTRNMKVYGMSGYRYRSTPTIQLKGEWLKEIGFDIGDYISITCENGRLVITPDAERAALKEAEDAFMEKETKLLQKRFEAEKKRLHAQFVAERKAEYAVVAEPGLEV